MGQKNYEESRRFYTELGFAENEIDSSMSYFTVYESMGFYLQDHYVKEWVENTMVFLELYNLDECYQGLLEKDLGSRYDGVRMTAIRVEEWGREFHLLDPAGNFWHFGEFGSTSTE